jgi:hypothetical protein
MVSDEVRDYGHLVQNAPSRHRSLSEPCFQEREDFFSDPTRAGVQPDEHGEHEVILSGCVCVVLGVEFLAHLVSNDHRHLC